MARSSGSSFAHALGRACDGTHDAVVRPASANIVIQGLGDLHTRWRDIAVEQSLGRDQDTRQAIAALAGLLFEEGLLQRVWPVRLPQPLYRHDRLVADGGERLRAGFLRLAVDEHHAATALFEPAAKFRPF